MYRRTKSVYRIFALSSDSICVAKNVEFFATGIDHDSLNHSHIRIRICAIHAIHVPWLHHSCSNNPLLIKGIAGYQPWAVYFSPPPYMNHNIFCF